MRYFLFSMSWVAVLLLLCLSTTAVEAWWAKGHMAVAEIARRSLKPEILAKVEACATSLMRLGPYPKSTNMVELGPWADDLKSMGLSTMSTWHYVDTPYNPDAVTLTFNPLLGDNIEKIVPMLTQAITAATATSDTIASSVANLIHYIGDAHMPLHSAALFSAAYPDGDDGGNQQKVVVGVNATTGEPESMKLHLFWDSMCQGSQEDPARPLSAETYAELQAFVDELILNNTFTDAEKAVSNVSVMVEESYNIAVTSVYPNADDGAVLTEEYKTNGQAITARRVSLAGFRLATVLNEVLENVSLETIQNATKQIEDGVEVIHTGGTYNYYVREGVEPGAAAGIFLSAFAIGCLLATAVVAAAYLVRRHRSPRDLSKPLH